MKLLNFFKAFLLAPGQFEELQQHYAHLQVAYENARDDYDRICRENYKLSADLASAQILVDSFQNETEALAAQIIRFNGELDEAKPKIEFQVELHRMVRSHLGEVCKEILAGHPLSSVYVDGIQSLKLQREMQARRVAELEEQIRGYEAFAEEDRKRAAWLQKQVDDREARLQLQAQRINELEFDTTELTKEVEEWRSLGYDKRTIAKATEQLVLEGAPGGEPAKSEPIEFETVEHEAVLGIARVWFDRPNTWVFTDGENEITAPIADKDFLSRIEKRDVMFGAGDVIRCKRETKSWRDEDRKLHARHRITAVLEVIPPTPQLELQPAAARS